MKKIALLAALVAAPFVSANQVQTQIIEPENNPLFNYVGATAFSFKVDEGDNITGKTVGFKKQMNDHFYLGASIGSVDFFDVTAASFGLLFPFSGNDHGLFTEATLEKSEYKGNEAQNTFLKFGYTLVKDNGLTLKANAVAMSGDDDYSGAGIEGQIAYKASTGFLVAGDVARYQIENTYGDTSDELKVGITLGYAF